ncbi:MAG: metallophosphatase, partial [Christiangramia sp.]|nr:metallophosphatase [Christiangramia sp.]
MTGIKELLPYKKSFYHLTFSLILFLSVSSLFAQQKEVIRSVYITSNTGLRSNAENKQILSQIVEDSKKGDSASLVVVGNIVPKDGFPNKDNGRDQVENDLKQNLLAQINGFKGNVVFAPGYNEWQADAPDNIDDLESFLQDNSIAEFIPDDGCPIESVSISDDIQLIMVDSQWYVEDWDEHPYINNDCEIQTRLQFKEEFNDELEDSQKKTVLVAVYHPVMSQNKLGFFQKIIDYGTQTRRYPLLKELMGTMETLARQYNDVIFISGRDKNLQ